MGLADGLSRDDRIIRMTGRAARRSVPQRTLGRHTAMAQLFGRFRFLAGALALALLVVMTLPAGAQRNPDGSVNPTAQSVKEQQLLNALGTGGAISGRVSIPDQKAANLIHPAGRDWRQFHEVTLRWIGAIAILGMLVLLVAFYLIRGQVKLESGFSGRRIV